MANSEAKVLRERRQNQAQRQQVQKIEENTPVAVGVNEPPRRRSVLGDPTEPRVAEAGGMVPDSTGCGYRVAECDVTELTYPPGCTTPLARVRWRAGQRVPVATYERWLATRAPDVPTVGAPTR